MNIEEFIISDSSSARDAIQRLNDISSFSTSVFIVNDQRQVIGSLTDGDIRRGLINGFSVDEGVTKFMFNDFKFLNEINYNSTVLSEFKLLKIRFIPFLKDNNELIRIIDIETVITRLPLDAVIMAGGKGERLHPLTEKTPKPLLVIGSKPIIEHNIDRLKKFGIVNFNISVRYLADQLINYLGDGSQKEIHINYIKEDKPLGTIGAVSIVDDWKNDYILIMNSDLLTNIDLKDFFEYFLNNDADMAVASVPYHIDIPYAVFEFSDGKQVSSLKEKPRYTYYSNAGIYIMKKELFSLIPKNEKFDATDLMESVIKNGKKLISYSVTSYWLDIGRMEDYTKAQEDIKHIEL